MKKVLWLTLALLLTFSLSAVAEEVRGKVKAIDRADHAFVLEDGTKLWVTEDHLMDLAPGDRVRAMYQMQGGKNIVTDLDHRMIGSDGAETSNFGTLGGTPADLRQAE